ncbi:Ubiquitinyl hydrolase 1 [Bertholletia excelsa]
MLKQSSKTGADLQNMEEKSCHPLPVDIGSSGKISRSLRDIPPAHYTLKIESFSQLSEMLSDTKAHNYVSEVFEASGYKWKLSLYPKGDKERNGEGHISLYLVIAETKDLPLGWEVNVNFKLFLFDQIQDKYMAIQDADGKVKRFHEMKTEWGFAQLVPLSVFNDANNGYLICDTCVFGVEIFAINYSGKGECISNVVGLESTHTWKISNFSALGDVCHKSDVFTIGNHNWELRLYPKGNLHGKKENSLSLYLNWCNPSEEKQNYLLSIGFA